MWCIVRMTGLELADPSWAHIVAYSSVMVNILLLYSSHISFSDCRWSSFGLFDMASFRLLD